MPARCAPLERRGIQAESEDRLVDGIGGIKLLERAMSADEKTSRKLPAFWAAGSTTSKSRRPRGPAR